MMIVVPMGIAMVRPLFFAISHISSKMFAITQFECGHSC